LSMIRHAPTSTLFPYTTLFRSLRVHHHEVSRRAGTCSRARTLHPPPRERLVGTRRHPAEVGFDAPFAFDRGRVADPLLRRLAPRDRKSTRLNSSHLGISYAVFC